MTTGYRKFTKGINLEPNTTTTVASPGDIDYNTTTNKATLYNGTADPIVTEADTATLTNKTINGSNNTITNVSLTSGVTNTLPIGSGGTNVTSVTTAPTATAFAGWDANKNLSVNNLIDGYTTTATAAGTTALLVGSTSVQYFTGSTTQTVTMPVVSTLVTGMQYTIVNTSTGVVTVESSGANVIQVMASNTQLVLTCISTSGTGTGSWTWTYGYIDGSLALTNPMTSGGDTIYGGSSGTPTRLANGSSGQVFQSSGGTSAPVWATVPGNTTIVKAPTVQKFTSGSGTYTLPTGPSPIYLKVRMVGGGGGGGGSGTSGAGNGGNGGNTTFGTSLLVSNGGNGATTYQGGTGGTASLGSGPVGLSFTGGSGQDGASPAGAGSVTAGDGAVTPFGGAGTGSAGANGKAAQTNTGSGGGGAGDASGVGNTGGGGGGGGWIDAIITSPSSTYSYSVGSAGTAGSAGTSGYAGGVGASGIIIVEEHYQ